MTAASLVVRQQLARLYGKARADRLLGGSEDAWPKAGTWTLDDLHKPGARGAAMAAARQGDESARRAMAEYDRAYRSLSSDPAGGASL